MRGPTPTLPPVAAEIDVVTVNLWGLPWPAARQRRVRKQRFREHASRSDYDVIGIQELWWPWRRSLDLDSLVLPRTSRDTGLALAGRLRVQGEPEVEHFRHGRSVDRLKRKGALRASLEVPSGGRLAVCVVHLQAGRRHARVRVHQLRQLLSGLREERRPMVLMGDFNFHRECEEDAQGASLLLGAGFMDAASELGRAHPTYHAGSNPYARRRRSPQRFDRVYLRSGSGVRLEPVEAEVIDLHRHAVSDHHPLRVRVHLSG
jgi:endonuclease/exonuclease/phosphatase family metal-dependent hydrolase